MKKLIIYPLVAIAAGLAIALGASGGFLVDPFDSSDNGSGDKLSEMVDEPAGREYDFSTQVNRLVRVGTSHTQDGDPVVFGANVTQFKNAVSENDPAVVISKRIYYCSAPQRILTIHTAILNKNDVVMTEADGTVVPQLVKNNTFDKVEINFMCAGIERSACTNPKGCV